MKMSDAFIGAETRDSSTRVDSYPGTEALDARGALEPSGLTLLPFIDIPQANEVEYTLTEGNLMSRLMLLEKFETEPDIVFETTAPVDSEHEIKTYKARITGMIDEVAAVSFPKNDWGRTKVLSELRVLTQLKHPSILKGIMHASGRRHFWSTMELVTGPSFATSLNILLQPPRIEVIRKQFAELCSAVLCLHSHRIYHRNLWLSNVFVDQYGHVKLLDFRSSKSVKEITLDLLEKRNYRSPNHPMPQAPELICDKGYYDHRGSEIWALGVIFHYMLTLSGPFPHWRQAMGRDDVKKIQYQVLHTEPQRIANGMEEEDTDLCFKMLVRNPINRADWTDIVTDVFFQNYFTDKRPEDLLLACSKVKLINEPQRSYMDICFTGGDAAAKARVLENIALEYHNIPDMEPLDFFCSGNSAHANFQARVPLIELSDIKLVWNGLGASSEEAEKLHVGAGFFRTFSFEEWGRTSDNYFEKLMPGIAVDSHVLLRSSPFQLPSVQNVIRSMACGSGIDSKPFSYCIEALLDTNRWDLNFVPIGIQICFFFCNCIHECGPSFIKIFEPHRSFLSRMLENVTRLLQAKSDDIREFFSGASNSLGKLFYALCLLLVTITRNIDISRSEISWFGADTSGFESLSELSRICIGLSQSESTAIYLCCSYVVGEVVLLVVRSGREGGGSICHAHENGSLVSCQALFGKGLLGHSGYSASPLRSLLVLSFVKFIRAMFVLCPESAELSFLSNVRQRVPQQNTNDSLVIKMPEDDLIMRRVLELLLPEIKPSDFKVKDNLEPLEAEVCDEALGLLCCVMELGYVHKLMVLGKEMNVLNCPDIHGRFLYSDRGEGLFKVIMDALIKDRNRESVLHAQLMLLTCFENKKMHAFILSEDRMVRLRDYFFSPLWPSHYLVNRWMDRLAIFRKILLFAYFISTCYGEFSHCHRQMATNEFMRVQKKLAEWQSSSMRDDSGNDIASIRDAFAVLEKIFACI